MSAIPKIQQFLKEQLRFSSSSLVFVGHLENFEGYSKDYLEEWFYLEKGKELGATAIYFRRFPDRPSVPQILIYDFSNQPLHSQETINKEITTLQNKVWSWGGVSSLYIFTDTALKIVDCSRSSDENDNPTFLEEHISLSVAIDKKIKAKYSGELFDSGLFWEKKENKNKFEFTLSAYDKLITGLKKIQDIFIKKSFSKQQILAEEETKSFVHRLIIQCILVKYLEERKVFPVNYFHKYENAQNFCDILRNGKVLELFDFLHKEQFNGNIFDWKNQTERQLLIGSDFTLLADLLDANIEGNQYLLWRLYDFEQIPIELISGIYEAFLTKKTKEKETKLKGVVYTPPHLVQFLVDECMPLKAVLDENHSFRKGKYKIIDPACGSGIFLVGTFKRLVQWWRIINKGKKPTVDDLKKILSHNIFGTEIIADAAMVSTFSLSLALCDLLSPKQIWTELRFRDLSKENVLYKDFFNYIKEENTPNDFDLVIGNPPFDRGSKQKGLIALEKERIQRKEVAIPQKQIALYFMEYSMLLLKDNGLQCLILPSLSLLYSYDVAYRNDFIERYNVLQIADFTLLARNNSLWNDGTDISTAVIFTEKSAPKTDSILHIVFKRTLVNRKKKYFELDEYDFHFVSREDALLYPFVWKANLLGGKRVFLIIKHFYKLKKIKDILLVEKENGCEYGEGFILSQIKKNNGTKSLKGEPFLDAKQTDTLDKSNFLKELEPYEEDLYLPVKSEKKNIYFGPHLIIKEIVHNREPLFILQTEKTVIFGDRFLGIYHPDKEKLCKLTYYLNNVQNDKFIRFYLYAVSASALILKNTALQVEDLLSIPITNDFQVFELNKAEDIIIQDLLNYQIDFITHLKYATPVVATNTVLDNFSAVFCKVLNNVFAEEEKAFHIWKIGKTQGFICLAFKYAKIPKGEFDFSKVDFQLNEEELAQLTRNQVGDNVLIRRIIRIYKDNTIYLIKPNQQRYWLQSIALRDADITYADLRKAGY